MAAMFRIVKLDGAEKYKVQQFFPERLKWFGLRKVEAGWKDMHYREYNGKSFVHHNLIEADRHIERLKHELIIAKNSWTVVKGEL